MGGWGKETGIAGKQRLEVQTKWTSMLCKKYYSVILYIYIKFNVIILIRFTKRHFVTRVKFIALYKELDKTQIYVHLNKQNFQYRTTHT